MLLDNNFLNMGILKSEKKSPSEFKHVEVLSSKKKKEPSNIEKKFRKPLKSIRKVKKELNSMNKEVKTRIRQVRQNDSSNYDFEKDMYKVSAGLMDSKIKAISNERQIIKDQMSLELKDKKLQKDASGISEGTNALDMRGNVASMFAGNRGGGGGFNSRTQANPELSMKSTSVNRVRDGVGSQPQPRRNEPESRDKGERTEPNKDDDQLKQKPQPRQDEDVELDYDAIEQEFGINYQNSNVNLSYRDQDLTREMHVDPDEEVQWVTTRDEEGNIIDQMKGKDIDTFGDVRIHRDDGYVLDARGEKYDLVFDKAENMPSYYKEQWKEKGRKFD